MGFYEFPVNSLVLACSPKTILKEWRFVVASGEAAREELGPLSEGRCYCLKWPAIIGGSYESNNLGTISLDELISFSGHMAEQTKICQTEVKLTSRSYRDR
jgi:hypothetical protein